MSEIACPTAAYLYTLSIGGPGLAWEYLRRNPGYRADWSRFGPDAPHARLVEPWGLRSL